MLDRNRRIKSHPERFQSCYDVFDVIFSAEERVYDQIVEGISLLIFYHKTPGYFLFGGGGNHP